MQGTLLETEPQPTRPKSPRDDRENRRPRGLDRKERSVAQLIAQRERGYQAAAWTMLIIGSIGCLVAPILLASLATAIESMVHSGWRLGWWPCFGLASLAVVPLLFWLDARSRTQWLSNEASDESVTIGQALLAPARTATASGAWGALLEIALPSVRMVLAARERSQTHVAAATLHDAAATLGFLRHFDSGVGVEELPTVKPLRVLCYLVSRDWVGVSKDGRRVWLLSESRKAIA